MRTAYGVGLVLFIGTRAVAQSPTTTPVAPTGAESAPPIADGNAGHGLIGIAEREAARSAKVLRDRILVSLRNWALQHELLPDRGKGLIDTVVNYGPDAVPVLIGFVKAAVAGQGEAANMQPAARALVGLSERTHNVQLIHDLTELVKGAAATIRIDVLSALETVDQKVVVEFAGPMLDDENPTVRAAAVRTLGHQKAHAADVAKLLRPQMQKEKGPWVETLRALHDLDDKASVDLAVSVLGSSQDPQLVAVALRYVQDFGGKAALVPLETLLDANHPSSLDDSLLKQALDSVQKIGLREIDAKKRAEEILLACMKNHPSLEVKSRACWQLGPYMNLDALKRLEDPVLKEIEANKKSNPSRSNTNNYVTIGEFRLRFELWTKAMEALKKAKEEDDKQFRASYIASLNAVAFCGLDKFEPAKKALVDMSVEERQKLLDTYPVLEKMVKDPKYHDLFVGK